MALRSEFTDLMGVRHPIALAPMGGSAGGALAAAVSNGGGLGLVGGGRGEREWLSRELAIVADRTSAPWTLTFVPVVVDLAGSTPVLAAGGIADGRGLAAALGASGALVGTRFQAGLEALVAPEVVKAIIVGHGGQTERSRILDLARSAPWPERYPARTLTNAFLDRWRGREAELDRDAEAKRDYEDAAARGDLAAVPVWASQAIDLITELSSASDLVTELIEGAERALARAAGSPLVARPGGGA